MISGLTVALRQSPCGQSTGVKRSFVCTHVNRKQVVGPVRFKEPRREGDGQKFEKEVGKAADSARDKAEDVKHKAASGAEHAAETTKGKASEAADRTQDAFQQLGESSTATLAYTAAAVIWAGSIVFKLTRPESTLAAVFRNTLASSGAEIAALTGTLSSSTFLLQAFAILAVPIAVGLLCQAHAARAGRLDSDSSMRLNFGFGVHSIILAATVLTSPMFPNLGARAVAGLAGYLVLMLGATLMGLRESRKYTSVTQILEAVIPGTISTVLRVLTPRSLYGAVYGILCSLAAAGAAYTAFGHSYVTTLFNTTTAEAGFALAHGDLVTLLTRGVAANLVYVAVAFAALKELADKGGLATTTARFLNFSMSIMLAGLTLLLSWGRQQGIASMHGAGMFGFVSQITVFMLVSSIVFSLYPSSKGRFSQDTPNECY